MRSIDDLRWRWARVIDRARERFRDHPRRFMIAGVTASVALLVLIFTAMQGGSHALATRVPMIDVASGDVFWISTGSRAVSVPAPHPETGSRTLVGIDREPDGSWRVLPHDLPLVATLGVRVSPRIDVATGAVAPKKEDGR
jgi:hypothetical protein